MASIINGNQETNESKSLTPGQTNYWKAPYSVDLSSNTPPLRKEVISAAWLGPREVAEANSWSLLRIGGNHSCPTPDHIIEAVVRAATKPKYSETLGLLELRIAIAEKLSAELGYKIDPTRNVLVTCGSMQAIYLALLVATGNGSGVIAHAPSFLYADLASISGIPFMWVRSPNNLPNWSAFDRALTFDTGLAIINTPCNPTGYIFTEGDLEALSRMVHGKNLWILSDEAMMTHIYDGRKHLSPLLIPELRQRTVVVRSFSKMYSMGPWRVGFAIGSEAIIAAMAKLLQWMIITVDSVAQTAALAAITGPQEWVNDILVELAQTRTRAVEAINRSLSLHAEIPQGGAVLWARLLPGSVNEEEAYRILGDRYGIPAVPGHRFGATLPYLRLPFGGEHEDVEVLLQRLPKIDLQGEKEEI